jgi:hypothetical protein
MEDYLNSLYQQAVLEYPFIAAHAPNITMGQGEGYAETYPVGETGFPLGNGLFSRPDALPINKLGIEIYKPKEFTYKDLAGEVLHGDPVANETRQKLLESLSTEQLDKLKYHALDYEQSLKLGMPENLALRNLADSALRGYVLNQFPDKVNQDIGYTKEQKDLFTSLENYMKTPYKYETPTKFTDPFANPFPSSIDKGLYGQ